ncbi:hypothetical protein TrRE_jg11964 [Triparma retinervis]|uniref:Uncharacterized protein n=1 Tax=Triparma retinervis TaxID=2557542 RepID=A0A9W7L555_9STRA|nr:hypothetical protein TrRE_jg11964 [Triparma retinervis]
MTSVPDIPTNDPIRTPSSSPSVNPNVGVAIATTGSVSNKADRLSASTGLDRFLAPRRSARVKTAVKGEAAIVQSADCQATEEGYVRVGAP